MQQFLRQANHNRIFLYELEKTYPDEFFDWKTTVVFYIALHWMRAFLWSKCGKKDIESHSEVRDYYRQNKHIMPRDIYDSYQALYNYSAISRYNGIKEEYDSWQSLRKFDYQKAGFQLENFQKYMKKREVLPSN